MIGDRRVLALAALCGVLFLTFLDNTIVGVALADLQTPLHASVSGLQWVVDGYMLAFAALMVAGGTLGDLLGRKRVMLAGLAVLIAGSVVSAVAPTTTVLIVGRVVMGIGAAASEPGTLSLIRHLYPEPGPRARAVGIWTAVSCVALSLGPIAGGILVGAFGWRGIFWFSVVAGAVALVVAAYTVPESRHPEGRFDVPGLALLATAFTAATFGIIEGEKPGYTTWWIVLLLAVAVAAVIAFVLVEARVRDPLVPLGFFRNSAYAMAHVVAFAANFALYAVFVFTALYLRLVADFSAWTIALVFIALAVVAGAASVLAGHPTAHVWPRWPMVAGCVVAGGGILIVDALLKPHASALALAAALVLVGVGFGTVLVTVTAAVLALVPAARSGMAASTVNTSRQLGGVMGVAILGAVISAHLTASLERRLGALGIPSAFRGVVVDAVEHGQAPSGGAGALGDPRLAQRVSDAAHAAYGDAMHTSMAIAAAVLIAAGVVAVFVPRSSRV